MTRKGIGKKKRPGVPTIDIPPEFVIEKPFQTMALSPNGDLLALVDYSVTKKPGDVSRSQIQLVDAKTGQPRGILSNLGNSIHPYFSVSFSGDSKEVAASTTNHPLAAGIHVWDIASSKGVQRYGDLSDLNKNKLGDGSHPFQVSPNGKFFAYPKPDHKHGVIRDFQTGDLITTFKLLPGDTIHRLTISPNSKLVAMGTQRTVVEVLDTSTGELVQVYKGQVAQKGFVESVAFSHDSIRIASAVQKMVHVWEAKTGNKLFSFSGHTRSIHSVVFSPDGKWLASGGEQGELFLRNAENGSQVLKFPSFKKGTVRKIVFSSDTQRIYVNSGSIRMWEMSKLLEEKK